MSAFDSTGNVSNDYASAALSGAQTVIYNNSSGNWRFSDITFTGTAVPEPSTMLLGGAAAIFIAGVRRRRAKSGNATGLA